MNAPECLFSTTPPPGGFRARSARSVRTVATTSPRVFAAIHGSTRRRWSASRNSGRRKTRSRLRRPEGARCSGGSSGWSASVPNCALTGRRRYPWSFFRWPPWSFPWAAIMWFRRPRESRFRSRIRSRSRAIRLPRFLQVARRPANIRWPAIRYQGVERVLWLGRSNRP